MARSFLNQKQGEGLEPAAPSQRREGTREEQGEEGGR